MILVQLFKKDQLNTNGLSMPELKHITNIYYRLLMIGCQTSRGQLMLLQTAYVIIIKIM